MLHDDSDDDLEMINSAMEEGLASYHGGTQRRRYIVHNRLEGYERLMLDYFAEDPVYPSKLYRRKFQIKCPLFRRIVSEVKAYQSYFAQERNTAGTLGFSSIQNITVVFGMLAHEVIGDYVKEYLRISEATAMQSLKLFVKAVISLYSDQYLRSPTSNDIARLQAIGERRGFLMMLGSINCMH